MSWRIVGRLLGDSAYFLMFACTIREVVWLNALLTRRKHGISDGIFTSRSLVKGEQVGSSWSELGKD